jgi:hypothetical protein
MKEPFLVFILGILLDTGLYLLTLQFVRVLRPRCKK